MTTMFPLVMRGAIRRSWEAAKRRGGHVSRDVGSAMGQYEPSGDARCAPVVSDVPSDFTDDMYRLAGTPAPTSVDSQATVTDCAEGDAECPQSTRSRQLSSYRHG